MYDLDDEQIINFFNNHNTPIVFRKPIYNTAKYFSDGDAGALIRHMEYLLDTFDDAIVDYSLHYMETMLKEMKGKK